MQQQPRLVSENCLDDVMMICCILVTESGMNQVYIKTGGKINLVLLKNYTLFSYDHHHHFTWYQEQRVIIKEM